MNSIIEKEYFTYQAVVESLVVSGEVTTTIDFEADSSFIWQKTTLVAFDAANAPLTGLTELLPSVDVFIRDTASGKNLMQQPVNVAALAGNGQLPYILPIGYEFKPKSTTQFTYTNNSGAVAYGKFGLVLHGYKIRRAG